MEPTPLRWRDPVGALGGVVRLLECEVGETSPGRTRAAPSPRPPPSVRRAQLVGEGGQDILPDQNTTG